jgi:hypothetical protein
VAFVHDQDSVEQLAAQCSDHAFANCIRPWRSRWTGKNPDAVCGEDRIERPGEPRIPVSEQEVIGGNTITEVHQQIPSGLGGPRTGRVRRHPGQMYPAGTVLDRDQRVNPPKEHGVHVHEIHGQDSLGLHRKELAPSRTRPARCGIDAGVMQDLPHGRRGDPMTEPDQLACTRRCPHMGFSWAIRITSFLIAAAVEGRPGRRRVV